MSGDKHNSLAQDEGVVFIIEPPRENDKPEQAAEQMLASIHGILISKATKAGIFGINVERISLEIICIEGDIYFLIWTPETIHRDVKEQILAQYPHANTLSAEQQHKLMQKPLDHSSLQAVNLHQKGAKELPVRTLQSFDVDPLAAITAAMASGSSHDSFSMVQVIISPHADGWQKRSLSMAKGSSSLNLPGLSSLWTVPEAGKVAAVDKNTAEGELDSIRSRAIIEKSHKSAYDVTIRLVTADESTVRATSTLKSLTGAFSQYHLAHLNSFTAKQDKSADLRLQISARIHSKKRMLLNNEELAGVFHLPHTNVETPGIVWAASSTSEPPMNLPLIDENTDISTMTAVGSVRFRAEGRSFGMLRKDRSRHLYILGQTGVGKSALLESLAEQDVLEGHGLAIIDPHGDYARGVISRVPQHRMHDVVYFNPADGEMPVAFNPMECPNFDQRYLVSSDLIGVFKRMFDSWGPRLEYILRYTILALLEAEGSTMLDITRLLTEKKFRKDVLAQVTDPVVLNFWNVEFASWNDKFQAEAISPVLNKIGAFVSNGTIRRIVDQPKSSFDIRRIMDDGKILVANLSRGSIGEDNAAVLGALLVTKIQLAAMSRVDIPRIEDRRPFYLYVDEFQNFATDSFATILSEARKFALNLTVANQYLEQMDPEVRSAVFGNVGSKIIFRVGADDGAALAKYFEPYFGQSDISGLSNRDFIAQLSINGESTKPFSGRTLDLNPPTNDLSEYIIDYSRKTYGRQPVMVTPEDTGQIASNTALPQIAKDAQKIKPMAPEGQPQTECSQPQPAEAKRPNPKPKKDKKQTQPDQTPAPQPSEFNLSHGDEIVFGQQPQRSDSASRSKQNDSGQQERTVDNTAGDQPKKKKRNRRRSRKQVKKSQDDSSQLQV